MIRFLKIFIFTNFLIVSFIFPSLAQQDFRLFSDKNPPEFEMGVQYIKDKNGLLTTILVGVEAPTLEAAFCDGFSDFARSLRENFPEWSNKEEIKFVGLEISEEFFGQNDSLSSTIKITSGNVYLACGYKSKDVSEQEVTYFNSVEVNVFGEEELDLRTGIEVKDCKYEPLIQGYDTEIGWFAVLLGFKCENGF